MPAKQYPASHISLPLQEACRASELCFARCFSESAALIAYSSFLCCTGIFYMAISLQVGAACA